MNGFYVAFTGIDAWDQIKLITCSVSYAWIYGIWMKTIHRIVPEIKSNVKTTMTLLHTPFHYAKSEAGESRWVLGMRANSINPLKTKRI